MRIFAFLVLCAAVAGCGDDTGVSGGSGGGATSAGGSTGDGGAGGGATGSSTASFGTTAAAGGEGGSGEGGAGGEAPIVVAPFLFELEGVAQPEPTNLLVQRWTVGGVGECTAEIRVDASLSDDTFPTLELTMCVSSLVLGEPTPLGLYDLNYTYETDSGLAFPSAVGTITVWDEGTNGRFTAIATGTIELPDEERTVPIRVEIDQPIDP